MDFKEIIDNLKEIKKKLFQFMIIVLIAGIAISYFKTTEIEMWISGLCCLIAIFLYRKIAYVDGFIDFLEGKEQDN